ncbi:MAG: hypothetical protein ACXWUG_01765 [Polyangiales bacterium]
MGVVARAHLFALAAWALLVVVELFVEVFARDDAALRRAARTHFLIDVYLEVPLLVMVLATGIALATRLPAWTALHSLKIGAGLVAVSANLYCVAIVLRRHAQRDRVEVLRRDTKLIRIVSPAIGVPAGLVAAWIGFVHFLR